MSTTTTTTSTPKPKQKHEQNQTNANEHERRKSEWHHPNEAISGVAAVIADVRVNVGLLVVVAYLMEFVFFFLFEEENLDFFLTILII